MSESGISLLEKRWSWIETHRPQIATALNQLGAEMPRQDRILLGRLAGWFSGNQGFESAIRRPDVLAICLPLIQADAAPSKADVGRTVRIGFCSIGRTISNRGGWWRLFLYPALILAAMAMVSVFFSVAIMPHFELMFKDFGIGLPKLTLAVFKFSRLVRGSWLLVSACLLGLVVFGLLMNTLTSGQRDVTDSWLDQQFNTTRNAVAGWAWHLAVLLDSGFGVTNAIEIAGNSQNNIWLKNACRNWLRLRSNTVVPEKTALSSEFGGRFHLINTTIGIDNRDAQIDLLKEIATYYWARDRNISDWWIRWLTSFLLWVLVLAIVLVVFAIYSPMISIVSAVGGF